ncbi:tyrosine-protein phosphatase Lar-like isoform X6 [Penaeus chinensis]|uniref:tyrosine-protein phosphatase Lar-like isoform X6 n=1 Tax=Penaeus chinensis TaxID=139456 RepID=UPI001FB793B4|nr:tyrosine-protein phosphatase Lar-like isoform X6 [Penaeus chinensis]
MEVSKSTSAFVFFAFLGVVASLKNIRASVITATFIQLEWESDKNENGLIPEYAVSWGRNSYLQTNTTTARLMDLEPGRRYTITIERINQGNDSRLLRQIEVRTASLKLSLQRPNYLRVAWDSTFQNLKAVQVTYRVELAIGSRVPSSSYTSNEIKIVNSTTAKILETLVPYYVRMTVCLQARQQRGGWSKKICDYFATNPGTPGPVRNLKITPDVHSLGLTWEDPDDTPPTGELDRVNIEVSNTCKTLLMFHKNIHNLVRDYGKRSFTVTLLQPDSDYTIQVSALNKGYGNYKGVTLNAHTLPGVPSSPRALLALPWSSTQVLLSWAPPDEPMGTLLNYTVWVNGKVNTCKENTLQLHRCKIDGLTPEENYLAEVAACNKLHCGRVVAKEVAMPSARVLPVWIPVLFASLLFIVLGPLLFMLWSVSRLCGYAKQESAGAFK